MIYWGEEADIFGPVHPNYASVYVLSLQSPCFSSQVQFGAIFLLNQWVHLPRTVTWVMPTNQGELSEQDDATAQGSQLDLAMG